MGSNSKYIKRGLGYFKRIHNQKTKYHKNIKNEENKPGPPWP